MFTETNEHCAVNDACAPVCTETIVAVVKLEEFWDGHSSQQRVWDHDEQVGELVDCAVRAQEQPSNQRDKKEDLEDCVAEFLVVAEYIELKAEVT